MWGVAKRHFEFVTCVTDVTACLKRFSRMYERGSTPSPYVTIVTDVTIIFQRFSERYGE